MANTLKFGNGEWYGKKDTILAYNDENDNYKPLPFDFSRSSSATVINKDGLIETVSSGQPRIDYKDDTKGALLLEPQRSNLVTYSEAFDNAYWIKNDATVVSGFSAPDETNNAFKLVEGTANGNHFIRSGFITTTDGGSIIPSIFVKSAERSQVVLKEDAYTGQFMIVDLIAETISTNGQNANLTKLANGWFRIDFKSIGKPSTRWKISPSVNSSSTYQGDGTSGLYIWGFQLEDNVSYPTSYIPTSGSAATRVADSSSQTVPDGVIGQTEGTIFLNTDIQKFNDSSFYIGISNGNSLNSAIYMYQPSNGNLSVLIRNSGDDNQLIISNANWSAGFNKIAITYTTTSLKLFINGVIKGSISFTGLPPFTKLTLGSRPDSEGNLVPKVEYKEVKLYNTALTDQELIELTTIQE